MEQMDNIQKIDTNKDYNITQKELNDFLNNKNTKDTDIKAIAEDLNKNNQYLLVTIQDTLYASRNEIANKIKKGETLTRTDILTFKLRLYLIEKKTNTQLTSKGDWKEIYADVMKINGLYKAAPFQKKQVGPVADKEKKEKKIENSLEWEKTVFAEQQKMLSGFVSVMRQGMNESADYRLYNEVADYVENELIIKASKQAEVCTTRLQYQSLVADLAAKFNAYIHNSGKTGTANPIYEYFNKHTIAPNLAMPAGTNPLGTDSFINFGNILWKLCDTEGKGDLEKVRGGYYEAIRQAEGKWTLLGGEGGRAALGGFSQDKAMLESMQYDVLTSQEMDKYPDLKTVKDFFLNLRSKIENPGAGMLGLRDEFNKLKSKLSGTASADFVQSLEKYFNEKFADLDKEVKTIYSEESISEINTMAAMQGLGMALQMTGAKFSEQELIDAGEYYKKNKKFDSATETKLKGAGVNIAEFYKYIDKSALDNRIKLYNNALANRLEAMVLQSALTRNTARADALYKANPLFKIYNDVYGIGELGGWSDDRIKALKAMADQIIISIATMAFAGGVGRLVAGAVLRGMAAKTIGGRVVLFCSKMIIEGTVFHATNTILTGVISQDRATMLEELKNPAGWARSVLYMGVMNGVSKVLNMGTLKLGSPLLKQGISPKYFELFKKGAQMPMEIGGMMITDQIVSLTFDQKLQDVTVESFIQTVTLVIGLKMAHKIVPSSPEQGDITSDEVNISGITKTEGAVTDITYQQKIMKTIDQKADYLSKLLKIKSSLRINTASNILNSMNIELKKGKNPNPVALEKVRTCIEDLKKEGKSVKTLEEKYEAVKKISGTEQGKLIESSSLPEQDLLNLENSFKADYEKGLTKEEVTGGRNLGIYKYQDKIFKVVKDKRSVSTEQTKSMNERLAGLDNVFYPIHSFSLKEGVSVVVMNEAPGKDASTLTPAEIEAIPQTHREKLESTTRELSKRGVMVDLTKRSNLLYDKEKGFQFLDINGISMDGSGTNKFFMKDGKEYYYPFEQYRFFEKTYTSAKDMFLNISNKTIVTQEGLPIFTLRDLSLEKREAMSIQEQSRHIQKLANLKTEPTGEEFGNYSKQIRRLLIQKLPPAEQREQIRIHDLMTDYRTIEKIKKDLPRFEEYLNGLPIGAKIVDIGAGKGIAINEIKNMQGKNFQIYAIDKAINQEHDLNKGIPNEVPMDCDFIYSDRTLQYTENPVNVIKNTWEHLKPGGKAILHLGYEFCRTSEALKQLETSNPGSQVKIEKKRSEAAGNEIYVILQKTSATEKIRLPEIESSLSNKPIDHNGNEIVWSNLYYDYRLVGEKEYKRNEFMNDSKSTFSEQQVIDTETTINKQIENLKKKLDKNPALQKQIDELIKTRDKYLKAKATMESDPYDQKYDNFLSKELTKEIEDAGGKIYVLRDKKDWDAIAETKEFDELLGINPEYFEELTNNALNYGSKNNPIAISAKKNGNAYEYSIYNLANPSSNFEKGFNIAKAKADFANICTIEEAKLIQTISMNIPSIIAEYRNSITAEKPLPPADAEYSKSLMDAFTTGDAPTRKQKIYEMTKDILENNPRLKSKISEEKTADEIAKEFADKTDGYTFMREDVFDVPDAANKGVMYIREKTEGQISYDIKNNPDGSKVCIATVTISESTMLEQNKSREKKVSKRQKQSEGEVAAPDISKKLTGEEKLQYAKSFEEKMQTLGEAGKQTLQEIKTLSGILGDAERAFMSSTGLSMYLEKHTALPNDYDIAMNRFEKSPQQLKNLYLTLQNNTSVISGVKFRQISTKKLVDANDIGKIKTLLENGDIKIQGSLKNTTGGKEKEFELFPEQNGNGVSNIGYKGKGYESFIIDGQKVNILRRNDLLKNYSLNFMNESFDNGLRGHLKIKKMKDAARLNTFFLFAENTGIGGSVEEVQTFLLKTMSEYSSIPESQRSPYVNKALKNCEQAVTLLDEALVFQEKYKKYISGTYATEKVSSLNNFHESINIHKDLLTEYFDIYTKEPNVEMKNTIQNELKALIKYMHSADFRGQKNEFAYVYEIYMTYRDFIRPLKLGMTMVDTQGTAIFEDKTYQEKKDIVEQKFGPETSKMPDVSEYKDIIKELIAERVEKNAKLSDELIPDDPLGHTYRTKAFEDFLRTKEGGNLLQESESLSPGEIQSVIDAHKIGGVVGELTNEQILDKGKILFTTFTQTRKEGARLFVDAAMDNGYTGFWKNITDKFSSNTDKSETNNVKSAEEISASIYRDTPILEHYKELLDLGILKYTDVLGKGSQAIVLNLEAYNSVVKLGLTTGKQAELVNEFIKHSEAYQAIEIGKLDGDIPSYIKIPKPMELMENTKGMFIIEKVNGQSLLSKQIIDYLASFSKDQITLDKNELKKLTKELENPSENQSSIMLRDKISQLKRDIARKENIQSKLPSIQKDIASGAFAEMTDYELKKFLTSKYNIAEAPFIDFMTDVEGALKKLYPDKLEGFQKSITYLEEKGLSHDDMHTGNIMLDKDGNLYIIDFGTIKENF